MLHLRNAAQRVRFEQVEDDYHNSKAPSQPLLIPIPIEFEPVAAERLSTQIEPLRRTGFSIEPLDATCTGLRQCPHGCRMRGRKFHP